MLPDAMIDAAASALWLAEDSRRPPLFQCHAEFAARYRMLATAVLRAALAAVPRQTPPTP